MAPAGPPPSYSVRRSEGGADTPLDASYALLALAGGGAPPAFKRPRPQKAIRISNTWTEQEDNIMLEHMGSRSTPWSVVTWDTLSSKLPRRSKASARTRWYEHLRCTSSGRQQASSLSSSDDDTSPCSPCSSVVARLSSEPALCPRCCAGAGKAVGHAGAHRTRARRWKRRNAAAATAKKEDAKNDEDGATIPWYTHLAAVSRTGRRYKPTTKVGAHYDGYTTPPSTTYAAPPSAFESY